MGTLFSGAVCLRYISVLRSKTPSAHPGWSLLRTSQSVGVFHFVSRAFPYTQTNLISGLFHVFGPRAVRVGRGRLALASVSVCQRLRGVSLSLHIYQPVGGLQGSPGMAVRSSRDISTVFRCSDHSAVTLSEGYE